MSSSANGEESNIDQNQERFEIELGRKDGKQPYLIFIEFLQLLANPSYLLYLGQERYFQKPEFVNYLKYLQYWKRAEYRKYVVCWLLG